MGATKPLRHHCEPVPRSPGSTVRSPCNEKRVPCNWRVACALQNSRKACTATKTRHSQKKERKKKYIYIYTHTNIHPSCHRNTWVLTTGSVTTAPCASPVSPPPHHVKPTQLSQARRMEALSSRTQAHTVTCGKRSPVWA